MAILRNKVLFTVDAAAVATAGLAGFVSHAPNRLISGDALALWNAADPSTVAAIGAVAAGLIAAAFVPRRPVLDWTVVALAASMILLVLMAAGHAAVRLAAISPPVARTSLGAAFWVMILFAALAIIDALQRLDARPALRILVAVAIIVPAAVMAEGGAFNALSIVQEYQHRQAAFAAEFIRHCLLVAAAVGPAVLVGIPLGILAARNPRMHGPIFHTLNLVQTIPSLALFGLLIAPLSALGQAVPSLGISGIGFAPAAIALILYALLPMVRNAYAGIAGVDPPVIETAIGIGFTRRQILWKVELPLALPMVFAGIRIVTVQAIGLAVVAALIGAGGLGSFVFQGLGQYAADLVLLGAVPAILLALGADFLLRNAALLIVRRPAT